MRIKFQNSPQKIYIKISSVFFHNLVNWPKIIIIGPNDFVLYASRLSSITSLLHLSNDQMIRQFAVLLRKQILKVSKFLSLDNLSLKLATSIS